MGKNNCEGKDLSNLEENGELEKRAESRQEAPFDFDDFFRKKKKVGSKHVGSECSVALRRAAAGLRSW